MRDQWLQCRIRSIWTFKVLSMLAKLSCMLTYNVYTYSAADWRCKQFGQRFSCKYECCTALPFPLSSSSYPPPPTNRTTIINRLNMPAQWLLFSKSKCWTLRVSTTATWTHWTTPWSTTHKWKMETTHVINLIAKCCKFRLCMQVTKLTFMDPY